MSIMHLWRDMLPHTQGPFTAVQCNRQIYPIYIGLRAIAADGWMMRSALRFPDSNPALGLAVHTSLPILDCCPHNWLPHNAIRCIMKMWCTLTYFLDQHTSWSSSTPIKGCMQSCICVRAGRCAAPTCQFTHQKGSTRLLDRHHHSTSCAIRGVYSTAFFIAPATPLIYTP